MSSFLNILLKYSDISGFTMKEEFIFDSSFVNPLAVVDDMIFISSNSSAGSLTATFKAGDFPKRGIYDHTFI